MLTQRHLLTLDVVFDSVAKRLRLVAPTENFLCRGATLHFELSDRTDLYSLVLCEQAS